MSTEQTVTRKIISFVNFEDVLAYIGFDYDEQDAIYDYVFCQHGAAAYVAYTIVRNHDALEGITSAMLSYYNELQLNDGDIPSRSIPKHIFTTEEIRTKFWEIVRDGEFINLEA